eukprot:TRINITY_DN76287_c0_g1_i1.p1 TRINITY_DN76287_c0_g1~~TRINITY_DN76287_c0_g1_i1.p1  ORF type:complete len:248 (-),score=52.64 TRINITY_DN76287_c0_g1_i1:122-763(-)
MSRTFLLTILALGFCDVADASRPQRQGLAAVQKQGAVAEAMAAKVKEQAKKPSPTLVDALKDTWDQGTSTASIGDVPAFSVVAKYCQWRTLFIMGMVLFAFARTIMTSVGELKKAMNALSKAESERVAAAANVTPMSARAFAQAEGLAAPLMRQEQIELVPPPPTPHPAGRGRTARPVAVQPQAGRRSHSVGAGSSQASQGGGRQARSSSVGR